MNRTSRRRRFVTSGLCLATMGGLVLSAVPMTASASPMVIASPLAPSIVGLGEGARGNEVKTVQGQFVEVDTSNGVKVDGASVIATDIVASNGVIHVIDTVILPD